jgi:hypothetical protein
MRRPVRSLSLGARRNSTDLNPRGLQMSQKIIFRMVITDVDSSKRLIGDGATDYAMAFEDIFNSAEIIV